MFYSCRPVWYDLNLLNLSSEEVHRDVEVSCFFSEEGAATDQIS